MKRTTNFLILLLSLAVGLISCDDTHFITDKAYREKVRQDFEEKEKQLPDGDCFSIFREKLTTFEREALMFLYAYMPIGDITDYPGEYYLENVRLSEQICEEMPWGKNIPEDVFRHFVLPIRVNNENLDDARKVFYAELKERVGGMNMHDAVLEVNHWCHEKVVYTPSDARTSAPLASVKTAYGRCGEESTFMVAALRAVGIPARQVYTPRWAHTDDNHAWVEAWVDGEWHFLGACEPEPVLDLGWFNTAASRGMLMHSKVFGRYEGKEEVMLQTPLYTEINLIDNYTESAKAFIVVKDKDGTPVENVKVEFKIYNYAEFYTVGTRYTDKEGITFLSAGRGDMLVWASKGGEFSYAKVSFGKDDRIEVALDKKEGEVYSLPLDIVPPPEKPNIPEVLPEQRAKNDARLAREDCLREAYVGTFMNKESATAFVTQHALPEKAADFLVASRGNWGVLTDFLLKAQKENIGEKAVNLLAVISKKDLRDVSMEVLEDHLFHSQQEIADMALFNTCILNPRVGSEMILPYKEFFQKEVSAADRERFRKDPLKLMEWCKAEITLREDLNQSNLIISPLGVWKSRVADRKSRNVFFVSVARSLGIPAWIDEVTDKIQYEKLPEGEVLDIDFDRAEIASSPVGQLVLDYQPTPAVKDPKYYTNFTLSKFKDGTFRLLSYDEGDVDMGGGTSWNTRFKNGTKLDVGYYMLASGVRQSDGSVPTQVSFFEIREGETTNVELVLREDIRTKVEAVGHLDAGVQFLPLGATQKKSISEHCGCGRDGYYVLAILGPGQEPTNHALRDIAALGRELVAWGHPMLLLFSSREQSEKYRATDFPGLPSTITYGIDENGTILKRLVESLKLQNETLLPVVVIANTSGEVVFKLQGYTIGLGEQLIKEIHSLNI